MTPDEQTELTRLSRDLFDISVSFRKAAKEKKSKLEVLGIMKDYCINMKDLHDYVVSLETQIVNEPTLDDLLDFEPECPDEDEEEDEDTDNEDCK